MFSYWSASAGDKSFNFLQLLFKWALARVQVSLTILNRGSQSVAVSFRCFENGVLMPRLRICRGLARFAERRSKGMNSEPLSSRHMSTNTVTTRGDYFDCRIYAVSRESLP